jgi:hypothetical protein
MPRVLIVMQDWLPSYDLAIKRVANLCRYLPVAGWSPHILTPAAAAEGVTTLTPEEIERSPVLRFAEALPRALAHGSLAEAGLATVRQAGIGAVLSLCPPSEMAIAGGEIARRAVIPWVALVDDLDALYIGPADGRSTLERRRATAQTRTWLANMWRVAAGTPRSLTYLREAFGVDGDVVLPAFDPEDRKLAPHRDPSLPLRIVHAGPIDRISQVPTQLFDALDALLDQDAGARDLVRLELLGSGLDSYLRQRLDGRDCASMVSFTERIDPWEALRVQREADVLVVLSREEPMARALGEQARTPMEIVELLPATRPIILLNDDGDSVAASLLRDTGAGTHAGDALDLARLLTSFLAELHSSGRVSFHGDDSAIAKYSAIEQVRRLTMLLDAASAERFGSWQRARA